VTLDEVLEKLEGVKHSAGVYSAKCPAHEDSSASLSASEGEGGIVLLKCHAGCSFEEIAKAVGMNGAGESKPVATYDYTDEGGALLYQVLRYEPKSFRQRQPDGDGGWIWTLKGARRVPYRLPQVIAQAKSNNVIFITEGEKDADAIKALGWTATTSSGGAGSWRKEFGKYFQGAHVVIWPDNDESAGHAYARSVRDSLAGYALSVRAVQSFAGKDAYDHLVVHGLALEAAIPIEIRGSSDVQALSDVQARSVDWHLKDLVQVGAFHLLIGAGGVGKGTWLARLASEVSRGATETPSAPRGVLVVISEDSPDFDLKPRLMAAGGDLSKVYVITGKHIYLPRDIDYLENLIVEQQAGLLIIDPVANHIGGDSDAEVGVRQAINELNFVAARTNCTIIGVRHTPKSDPTTALGSVAWVNSPRIVLLFREYGGGSKRSISVTKSNRSVTGKFRDYHLIGANVPGVSNRVPRMVTPYEYEQTLPAPTEVQDDPWFTKA
jgi:hypothetical protein